MIGDVLGTERFEGMLGFDLVTYRGDALAVDSDMNINVVLAPNLDETRDRFDLTEGISGYNQNDTLRGTDRLAADMVGHEANAAATLRIRNLRTFLRGATTFTGGDILMGGAGSDLIEGRGGNDVIDGDAWLNVQLVATLNSVNGAPGVIKRADSLFELREDVFANPQRLNPGQINIDRFIVTPAVGPADCGAATPVNCDTALFTGNRAGYSVVNNGDGTFTVTDSVGTDGVDTLRNIEQLQYADGVFPIGASSPAALVAVPNVVGDLEEDATDELEALGFVVDSETGFSATVAAGNVISTNPVAGTLVANGSTVILTISAGAPAPTLLSQVIRNSQGALQITSPAIVPPANTLIVAFIAADGPVGAANTIVNSVTNIGGTALTWTRQVRSNVQLGTAEIWTAFTTPAHASMTVRAVLNNDMASTIAVMMFSGADPSMVGAARLAANAPTGAPTASIVTTRSNSLVFGVGVDWDRPRAMIAGANQTRLHLFRPDVGDTYWVQRVNDAVLAAGTSATISDTYSGAMTDRWNMALIEIRRRP
jgi:hypothetical protein